MTSIPTNFTEAFGGNIGDAIVDPYSVYTRLRQEAPCHRFNTMFGDMYFVTTYAGVKHVLESPTLFSSTINDRLIGTVIGSTIIGMDEPDHNAMRKLVMPFFIPGAIRRIEDSIRGVAGEMVDRLNGKTKADLVSEFTFTYPLAVFDRLMLGAHLDDAAQFHEWVRSFLKLTTNPTEAMMAVMQIREFLAPVIARARSSGVVHTLVERLAQVEVDGERLSDDQVTSFLILLLQAGAETTSGLLGSALYHVLASGLWRSVSEPGVIDAVFDETLRFESPVQFVARATTEELEIEGTRLQRDAFVVPVIGSANRDEAVFQGSDHFSIDRDPDYWNSSLHFGFGPHYCAGAHLARAEFFAAFSALAKRYPHLRLADETWQEGVVGFPFRAPRTLPVLLS